MMFKFLQRQPDKGSAAFMPKFDDVPVEKLVEIQGKTGPFYVTPLPGLEHLGGAYFYGDARQQFFFFIAVCPDKAGVLTVRVYEASLSRTRIVAPTMPEADITLISENIALLFKTRDFSRPSESVKKKYLPERIVFDWEIIIC